MFGVFSRPAKEFQDRVLVVLQDDEDDVRFLLHGRVGQ